LVTVLGALSGRSAIVIVPPFASVMTAFDGAFTNVTGFTTQAAASVGAAVRTTTAVASRVGDGVGAAAVLPQADPITASAARSASPLMRR